LSVRKLLGANEGGVAVVVALLLTLVFVPMSALVTDGGRLFVERSATQNAADHAALAATWAECTGKDPQAAGRASATRNGYDGTGTNTVALTKVESGWRAEIASGVQGVFAPAIGVSTLTVRSQATASCHPAPKGGAIYAHGSSSCNSSKTIDWPGSTITITGDVHTNGELYVGGSSNTVIGQGTYANAIDAPSSKLTWVPNVNNPTKVPARDWPIWFDFATYQSAGGLPNYFSAGSSKIDAGWLRSNGTPRYLDAAGNLRTGIYYTAGEIDISDSNIKGTATFVAGGRITLGGSTNDVKAYHKMLLAFSNYDAGTSCGDPGIKMSGSGQQWQGIVFAPRSMVELSGSSNSSFEGTIVARTIRLNGSSLQVKWDGSGATGDPFVGLGE
jgi:hypothetical protein